MTRRGDVCWADLGEPRGSKPAKRRPVLVIQADPYNASRLNTTLAAVLTSSTGLAAMPGNIFVPAIASGLPRDSVVNVTALVTLDKTDLDPAVGRLPASLMHEVDRGLRRVLGLLAPRPARKPSSSGATPAPATTSPPRRRTADLGRRQLTSAVTGREVGLKSARAGRGSRACSQRAGMARAPVRAAGSLTVGPGSRVPVQ